MTQLTCYPLGCADTTLIELQHGKRMLVDFAATWSGKSDDRRCDLPKLLRADLKASGHKGYRVVAFTHLDADHCLGASEFFFLRHADKYQTGDRATIDTLWVPAAAITEPNLKDDALIIREEAKHRLREGKGIKVFSRPERLRDWFEAERIPIASRTDCLVDAGWLVPGFDIDTDGVEFFAHSPHARRTDERGVEDRNGDSLVFQARFREGGYDTDILFTGDVTHEVLAEIVDITRYKERDDRLHWNVYHLPHHCSYTAIGPNKGNDKTLPVSQVKWLCETQGERDGYIISPSLPIPLKGTAEDRDVLPPHRQAAEYYRTDVLTSARNLLVTMSEPSSFNPKPIVIRITDAGAIKGTTGTGGAIAAASVVAPRAG